MDMDFDQLGILKKLEEFLYRIEKFDSINQILIIGDEAIFNVFMKKYKYSCSFLSSSYISKIIKNSNDGFKLDYDMNCFDLVIAIDMIEHMERNIRSEFLAELDRISAIAFILGSPLSSDTTMAVENRINFSYRELHGKRSVKYDEHRDFGVPSKQEIIDILDELKLRYLFHEHSELNQWEQLTESEMILRSRPSSKNDLVRLHEFYYKNLALWDSGEKNYRQYIIASSKEQIDLKESEQESLDLQKNEKLTMEFNKMLITALAASGVNSLSELRENQLQFKELEADLMKMIDDKDRHIYNLENKFKPSYIKDRMLKIFKEKKIRRKLKKIIKPFYNMLMKLRIKNIKKAISFVRQYGFRALLSKAISNDTMINYDRWARKQFRNGETLLEQAKERFEYSPLVSIIVPTYNTPIVYLKEMLDSVIKQSYSNWELCIADGHSKAEEVRDIIKQYSTLDKRIKSIFLEQNSGISGNTNEALGLATGDYIGLLDHDDLLTPDALYEVVKAINNNGKPDVLYSDEDKTNEKSSLFFEPNFKPDFSPDTLRSYNYICHFLVFKRELLEAVGNFNKEYDGAQDHDLVLRLTEKANLIYHIPRVLYHWRVHQASTAASMNSKSYAIEAGKKAISAQLERQSLKGSVKEGLFIGSYKVDFLIEHDPKISIIIPNRDETKTLRKCIDSILDKSTYSNYEIIVVENNSRTKEIFEYYKELEQNRKISVIRWEREFNFSAINNFAVQEAKGEYVLLLNNDIEVISENWLEEMLMFAQRTDVGIVGAKLYYPDNTIQHAGVILGIGGVAGHSHKYFGRNENGFIGRLKVVQNLSAVTAACLMVRKELFTAVDGLDENYGVAFNDIDFCMKIRELGKLVVFNPYVELYHHESKSRGLEDTPEKIKRFKNEMYLFKKKWGMWLQDPYYNVNLSMLREDFSLKMTEEEL